MNKLLQSEIHQVENLANSITGYNKCKITDYTLKETRPIELDRNIIYLNSVCKVKYDKGIITINLTVKIINKKNSYHRSSFASKSPSQ